MSGHTGLTLQPALLWACTYLKQKDCSGFQVCLPVAFHAASHHQSINRLSQCCMAHRMLDSALRWLLLHCLTDCTASESALCSLIALPAKSDHSSARLKPAQAAGRAGAGACRRATGLCNFTTDLASFLSTDCCHVLCGSCLTASIAAASMHSPTLLLLSADCSHVVSSSAGEQFSVTIAAPPMLQVGRDLWSIMFEGAFLSACCQPLHIMTTSQSL